MKASDVAGQQRAAAVVVRLDPSDWADDWGQKPSVGVAVGLRFISDADESEARRDAAEAIRDWEPTSAEESISVSDHFNDTLVARLIGAALCDPHDVTVDPQFLELPRETARRALTSRALRRLYTAYDTMAADLSPVAREATDEEIVDLLDLLADGTITRRARRLLGAILDELTES